VIAAQGALIAAAAVAADGVTGFIQSEYFGWRQPLALVTTALAVAAPIAGLAWWVGLASHGDLVRTSDATLPAYVVDQMQGGLQQRVLVLRGDAQHVTYDVLMDDGVRLGDDSVDPEYGSHALDDVIADIVSEGRAGDASRLTDFGIGYVMAPAPVDPALVAALNGLPGLSQASTDPDRVLGWQFSQPTGLARLHDPAAAPDAGTTLTTRSGELSSSVPSGAGGRVLDLAVSADDGFAASLDGDRLPSQATQGGVRFDVGSASGRLEAGPSGHRGWWLAAQGLAVVVCVVLAAPSARRRQGIAEAHE
jgi:hypothetical protein